MHAEKRAGPSGQNNGGTFPGSQANSDSSQPVTTALSFLSHPSLYSLNENNDIIVLCMKMLIGTAGRSHPFIEELSIPLAIMVVIETRLSRSEGVDH